MKRVPRWVSVPCGNCLGGGIVPTNHGPDKCPVCRGTGDVDKIINVLVHDDEEVTTK